MNLIWVERCLARLAGARPTGLNWTSLFYQRWAYFLNRIASLEIQRSHFPVLCSSNIFKTKYTTREGGRVVAYSTCFCIAFIKGVSAHQTQWGNPTEISGSVKLKQLTRTWTPTASCLRLSIMQLLASATPLAAPTFSLWTATQCHWFIKKIKK